MTVVLAILSAFVLGGFTVYSFGGKFIVKRHSPALLDLVIRTDRATEQVVSIQKQYDRLKEQISAEQGMERELARELMEERQKRTELEVEYEVLTVEHEIVRGKYEALCQEKVIEAWARDFARRDES